MTIIQFIITQNYRQENKKKSTLTMLDLNVHNFEKFAMCRDCLRILICVETAGLTVSFRGCRTYGECWKPR